MAHWVEQAHHVETRLSPWQRLCVFAACRPANTHLLSHKLDGLLFLLHVASSMHATNLTSSPGAFVLRRLAGSHGSHLDELAVVLLNT